MDFAWILLGICEEFAGDLLGLLGILKGFRKEFARMPGFCLDFAWIFVGFCEDFARNVPGFCWDFAWNLLGFCWEFIVFALKS